MHKELRKVIFFLTMLLLLPGVAAATSYTVVSGATQLAAAGTSSDPAEWSLNANFVTSAGVDFKVGDHNLNYNYLTIDGTYSFTAGQDLTVGYNTSLYNQLNIIDGGQVTVACDLYNGKGNISYYSENNVINVSGASSLLSVNGNLDMSNGKSATNNHLRLTDNGLVAVAGDFSLYYHWTYGNNWLELGGGALLLSGDKTADFSSGNGILSSIKVWDEVAGEFKRVAEYDYTTLVENTKYMNMFSVVYLEDVAVAADLGFSSDYVGYTVLRNVNPVPIPTTLLLLASGLAGLGVFRRRRQV